MANWHPSGPDTNNLDQQLILETKASFSGGNNRFNNRRNDFVNNNNFMKPLPSFSTGNNITSTGGTGGVTGTGTLQISNRKQNTTPLPSPVQQQFISSTSSVISGTAGGGNGGGGKNRRIIGGSSIVGGGGGGNDYDNMSVYTNNNNMMIMNFPPLSEKEKKERREEWIKARLGEEHNIKTLEAKEQKEVEKIFDSIQRDVANSDISRILMHLSRTAFAPFYCHRLHFAKAYFEIKLDPTKPEYVEWKPKAPILCFGSYSDYAQGEFIELKREKSGRLDNTYIPQIQFKNVHSNIPCAIGVILGEGTDKGFIPWNNKLCYTNTSTQSDGVRGNQIYEFHTILTPYHHDKNEDIVYKSTYNMNDSYGKDYPYLTANREDITKDCSPNGDKGYYVPVRSALFEFLMCDLDLPAELKPQLSREYGNGKNEVYYTVSPSVYELGILGLQTRVEMNMPVRNMENFTIRFYPLSGNDCVPFSELEKTKDSLLKKYERLEIYENSQQKSNVSEATLKGISQVKGTHGLCGTALFDIMFRDHATDGENIDEQQLYDINDDELDGIDD